MILYVSIILFIYVTPYGFMLLDAELSSPSYAVH